MNRLYGLILNNRELIEKKTIELCEKDSHIKLSINSRVFNENAVKSLFNIFIEIFGKEISLNEEGKDYTFLQLNQPTNAAQINILMGEGYTYKQFAVVISYLKYVIKDFVYTQIEDNGQFYRFTITADRCFDSLRLMLYDELDRLEDSDAVLKKIFELKKQANESIKLLNETLEYDKVKTEFFSNLSHELRTPLNVILGTLQVMDMFYDKSLDNRSEKVKKYSKIMRQNCYRLLRLVNNLIDINKLDAGYMKLNMNNHDIVNIVAKIAASVTDYIENKGIEFSFNTKTTSKVIACDPDKMERILLNLLSNAVKFTDKGGRILVELWDDDTHIFILVKDNGVGIPKDKHDLIFKRFAQVDKSLARNHQGSGIGLSLVKSLVELQGGTISFTSDSGAGCEFLIELPIGQIEAVEANTLKNNYTVNDKIEVINIEFADIYA